MNEKDAEYMVYCSRCGSQMKNTSRYCMKCGNLNPDHPLNKEYGKILDKANKKEFIKKGLFSVVNTNEINSRNTETIGISSDPGGFNLCFFINIIVYLILAIAVIAFFYFTNDQDFIGLVSSNVGYILLGISVFFFYSYAWEVIFIKVNLPWWSSLIPIYNFYLLAGVLHNGKRSYKMMTLIPIVGQAFSLYLMYELGECFKVSGILMVILAPFYVPSVAFGGNSFNNVRYVSSTTALEGEYKKKKTFATICILFALLSLASIGFTSMSELGGQVGDVNTTYLLNIANDLVKDTVTRVKAKDYVCDFEAPVFYFYYENVADYLDMPLAVFHDKVSAYVKVENTGIVGEYNYYISLTDGENGFPETLSSDLSNDKVVEYPRLNKIYDNGNTCR